LTLFSPLFNLKNAAVVVVAVEATADGTIVGANVVIGIAVVVVAGAVFVGVVVVDVFAAASCCCFFWCCSCC